ncbi:hypothetical protein C8R45DRAFT_894805 [Mycena sanguinolenta]|nr:hypothetical protein C8R45DRAFT_894805 [Mycena sanguinolenta]
MSAPPTLAILGASGTLGSFLLQALSMHSNGRHVPIHILTRPASTNRIQILASHHPDLKITIHPIDYTADESTELEAVLRGVDVVISLVGDDSGLTSKDVEHTGFLPGFITQDKVARAAKAVGVKLFAPSEYGSPTHLIASDAQTYVVGKRHHHALLRSLELPYLLVYSGMFSSVEPDPTPLPPLSATDPIALGDPPFETTRHHLATYIIHLLLDRGVDEIAGGIYVLRGVRRDKGLIVEGETKWILDA